MPRKRRTYALLSVVLMASGAALPGCSATKTSLASGDGPFLEHRIDTGVALRQTVVIGRFLGGDIADIATVDLDEHETRHLRIIAFNGESWLPALEATLGSDTLFVDVVTIGGRDRLLAYAPGHLTWFDPVSMTQQPLVDVVSDFSPPTDHALPHVDITRDLNNDGLDDLVVPGAEGFSVFVQLAGGTFAEPVKVGPGPSREPVSDLEGYRYDPWVGGRVHQADLDHDDRDDLVYWKDDHFEVHWQSSDGGFPSTPTPFTTDVHFDSDDVASLVAPLGVRSRRFDHQPAGEISGSVLHAITDMNGDGIADLVVFSLHGGSLMKLRSRYDVHVGSRTPDGGTTFAYEAGATVHSDGIPFDLRPHDFDGDGQVDVMYTLINPGPFKIVGMLVDAALTQAVSMDLHVYRMDQNEYPRRPSARRTFRRSVAAESGERAAHPPMMLGDVDGDGLADFLIGHGGEELLLYHGKEGAGVLAQRPARIPVTMPFDEEHTWLADLNADGRADVVMHHPSADAANYLTVLMAQ